MLAHSVLTTRWPSSAPRSGSTIRQLRRSRGCCLERRRATALRGAESLIIDVALDARRVAAHRARRIAAQLELAELHLERVVGHDAPRQGVPFAEDDLDRLGGLQGADDAAQDAEHSGLLARWCEVRRRRLGVPAAVARSLPW